MKRNAAKRVMTVLFSFLLTVTLFEMQPVCRSSAEIGSGASVTSATEDTGIGHGVIVNSNDYSLSLSNNQISFGTITAGTNVTDKTITVTNTCAHDINMIWTETDPDQAFLVDAPNSLYLTAGQSLNFNIVPNPAKSAGSYTIVFTFGADTDPSYAQGVQAIVTVTIVNPTPTVTAVAVIPASISVARGKTYGFQAQVSGTNSPNTSVTWKVSGQQNSGTSIDSNGILTVAGGETAGSLTVTAVSNQNNAIYGTAAVALTGGNHNVTVKADPAGAGAVSGGGAVANGGSMQFNAAPNNGYAFQGWYLNNSLISNGNSYTLNNITADQTMVAKFTRTSCMVKINVNNKDGGTVSGGGSVSYGGSIAVKASPANGYKFNGWQENNNIISTDQTFQLSSVTTDRNLTAVFKPKTRTIAITRNPQNGGTVGGAGQYNEGSSIQITATPASGYTFASWTLNGQLVSTSAAYNVKNINEDRNYVANFTQNKTKTYSINASVSNTGGVITPQGKTSIVQGTSITFMIAPKNGYKIESIIVDNKAVTPNTSYTFTNVTGNHSIIATFSKKQAAASTPQTPAATAKTPAAAQTPAANSGTASVQGSGSKKQSSSSKKSSDKSTAAAAATENTKQRSSSADATTIENEETANAATIDGNPDAASGLLQVFDMSQAEAISLIQAGQDAPLILDAFNAGYLQVTVNNQYASSTQETADNSYESDPSIPNFNEVVSGLLTDDEEMSVLEGDPMALNISITDASNSISDEDKTVFKTAAEKNVKLADYFNILFMKTKDGTSEMIEELPVKMQVVLDVPENVKDDGREYYIARVHDGTLSILSDIDDDPNTITFETDRFSAYAIGYAAPTKDNALLNVAKVFVISILVAVELLLFIQLYLYIMRRRRRNR